VNRLIAWFAANPVAANLLMMGILAAGVIAATRVRQESFPRVAFDVISIGVAHPGAPPDEVERAICVRIEEAVHGVKGIRRLRSQASEGYGAIWAELEVGADARRAREEIQNRVDALEGLPEEAETPVVQELVDDSVLLAIGLHGDVDERTLRAAAERLRDAITALPEVSRAELRGARPYELAIEVSETDLRRHALGFDDVVRAVRASSLDLAGGALKTRGGEILLRTRAQAYRGSEFERVVLLTREDGTRLALGDVARVVDGFAETDERVRVDGEPAVVVRLLTSEPENILVVAAAVEAELERARAWFPPRVQAAIFYDQVGQFEDRRDLLLRNGAQGLVLILGVLALFLPLRLAGWVAAGIPVAFFGAIVVMVLLDVSINMMSLFAFIVALGLVVDDAIIVGENVARCRQAGGDPLRAAIAGATDVGVPVTVAVLTTVLFVMPTLSLPTVIGKTTYSLGVVVIACLLFSLVESLLVLPAHLAGRRSARPRANALARLQQRVDGALERFVTRRYQPLLERCVAWPSLTLAVGAALWLLTIAVLVGGWVRWTFIPYVEDDYVTAQLVMPRGTPPEAMEAAVARIEGEALGLREELEAAAEGGPVLEAVMVAFGDAPYRHDDMHGGGDGANLAHVLLDLVPGEGRDVSSIEVEELWRARVGRIAGAQALTFSGSDLSHEARLDVSLSGGDRERLRTAADALRRAMEGHPALSDVSDSESGGKQELRLRIRAEAEAMGLSLAELVRQVRQGFHGEEVQRISRGRDDVAVVVRYPRSERRSLSDLEAIRIRLPDGTELPFSAVAQVEIGRGSSSISRRERRSQIAVSGRVDSNLASGREVIADLEARALPQIVAAFPGVRYDFFGATRNEGELNGYLLRAWLLALVGAYALLAVPLRSYLQPLIIFAAIPFGLVGAVVGHALLGIGFSGFSQIGLVALTGVVVNDSLVLLHRANRLRDEGRAWRDALIRAATTRFRPILLTALTTFFGLLPLLFERSAQAAWLEPIAAALGFGVIFATGISLVLVPTAALVLDEFPARLRKLGAPGRPSKRASVWSTSRTLPG
jgi:multidrug efflux pump subunit AcrB